MISFLLDIGLLRLEVIYAFKQSYGSRLPHELDGQPLEVPQSLLLLGTRGCCLIVGDREERGVLV